MTQRLAKPTLIILTFLIGILYSSLSIKARSYCMPLDSDSLLSLKCIRKSVNGEYMINAFTLSLKEEFEGKIWMYDTIFSRQRLHIDIITADSIVTPRPIFGDDQRYCMINFDHPIRQADLLRIEIPAGFFEIYPDNYTEVDSIDIDEQSLLGFSVAGAWHKSGTQWHGKGIFSIIDDDSIDGQIPSSVPGSYSYGYYSLLYPLLESLGLRGNLAVEGRRTGLHSDPPKPNDNLTTIIRLQNEKGWDVLSHSMICLGETLNNWMVDSLDSPLAETILREGPENGERGSTVSVFDMKTKKQYWPDAGGSSWVETPRKFIKPYIGDYDTKEEILYNPDFDIDWHWGEWKRRAMDAGIDPKGFVTHNSTSSHALVAGIADYFPYGFSDISTKNINTVPLLSSAVRSGLEGQSMKGYDSNSTDNSFNNKQFKAFCSQIDKAAKIGGWIMFNLHTYRDCWKNSRPGMLVSEGGTYPDEWVIPMRGIDSANSPLSPPAALGITDWSEWYPCPGTRLHMMWSILKYALENGLINVTSSEGFEIMGNRKASGYFSQRLRFGMDTRPTIGNRDMYRHYIVSASQDVYYFNPLISDAMAFDLSDLQADDIIDITSKGKFVFSGQSSVWFYSDAGDVSLRVSDPSGKVLIQSQSNHVSLRDLPKGIYIVSAISGNRLVDSKKTIR